MKTKTSSNVSQQRPEEPREQTSLRSRYGEIGIPAVAAAARYSGDSKTQSETESAPRIDQRFVEFAA